MKTRIARRPNLEQRKDKKRPEPRPYSCPEVGKGCPEQAQPEGVPT